jgi:superfamily II DNA or RNA helicase
MIDEAPVENSNEFNIDEFYGEKQIRWYQVAARNAVADAVERGVQRILVVLPTGAGKTITIAASLSFPRIRKALGVEGDRPLRVLFVAHKHRLLTQAEQTFTKESNVELILQSMFTDIPEDVLKNGWDVAVLDESHHESCMSMQYQLEKVGDKVIIGLTATPDRADGCLIKFEEIIEPISRQQAVEEGFLAPTKIYSFVDAPEKNKTRVVKDILDGYIHLMGQTMVFMRTKKEASEIHHYIQSLGYKSVFVDSQPSHELDQILDDFSAGQYNFVVNCSRISEGVDVKKCESVLLGRTFASYPLLNQVIGRAARPDSDCRVWEIINPLSGYNLETTAIVGEPEIHVLSYRKNGKWFEEQFDYTTV